MSQNRAFIGLVSMLVLQAAKTPSPGKSMPSLGVLLMPDADVVKALLSAPYRTLVSLLTQPSFYTMSRIIGFPCESISASPSTQSSPWRTLDPQKYIQMI